MNDTRNTKVLAIEGVAGHNAGVDVIKIIRRIPGQEIVDLQVDAFEVVNEQPAMVTI